MRRLTHHSQKLSLQRERSAVHYYIVIGCYIVMALRMGQWVPTVPYDHPNPIWFHVQPVYADCAACSLTTCRQSFFCARLLSPGTSVNAPRSIVGICLPWREHDEQWRRVGKEVDTVLQRTIEHTAPHVSSGTSINAARSMLGSSLWERICLSQPVIRNGNRLCACTAGLQLSCSISFAQLLVHV